MELNKALQKVKDSSEYTEFMKDHPDAYLTHCFRMMDKANEDSWQIGFFDKAKDKLTAFFVSESALERNPEADALKKNEDIIRELDMDKVRISFDKAIDTANKFQKEKFPNDVIMKKIGILQHLPVGQVYNLTYVTQGFKILNMKVDSSSGKVIEHKLSSIMDMGSVVK